MNRRRFLHVAASTLGMALFSGCEQKTLAVPVIGGTFPEFFLPDLNGQLKLTLSEDGPYVINFWASWCAPCRYEMRSLQKLAERYRSENLLVIGITVDDDLNLAKEFLQKEDIRFSQFSDRNQTLSKSLLGLKAIPATFLIDQQRKIKSVILGDQDWASPEMLQLVGKSLSLMVPKP